MPLVVSVYPPTAGGHNAVQAHLGTNNDLKGSYIYSMKWDLAGFLNNQGG